MKKYPQIRKINFLYLISSLIFLVFLFSSYSENKNNSPRFKYIGIGRCVTCHLSVVQGAQYDIWENTKHSKAWMTLKSEKADKIANEKGFTTKAYETPECIKCHVLGKDIEPDELTSSFSKENGVQCESCHGPGSRYSYMAVMKNKKSAVRNGLIIHKDKDSFCITCHNSESPTFKGFDFDSYWDRIKHPIPITKNE